MYIVTAPQDGQIVQANKSGIGEILKDGETITIIVPNRVNYAVEMFVNPMDLVAGLIIAMEHSLEK
jgi:HlyD family secretion protein